jgi:hypothetical protein
MWSRIDKITVIHRYAVWTDLACPCKTAGSLFIIWIASRDDHDLRQAGW